MKNVSILFLFTLLLTAGCGGGGSDSSDNSSSDNSSSDNSNSDNSNSDNSSHSRSGPSCGIDGKVTSGDQYSVLYPFCVEKGRVTYDVNSTHTGSSDGTTMLMKTTGVDILTFADWGHIRKQESTSHTDATIVSNGQTKRFSFDNHKMTKVIDKTLYNVRFEAKEIDKTDFAEFVPSLDYISDYVLDDGKGTIYDDAGTSIVSNHICDKKNINMNKVLNTAFTASNSSSCAEKGVELETILDLTSSDSSTTSQLVTERAATNIEFNILITADDLALPDFSVINGAQLQYDPNAASVLYSVKVRATPVGCSDGSGSLIVKNDVINGNVRLDNNAQVFDVFGEIGPDKKIYGGFVRGSNRVADYKGVATDIGLSGTWEDFGGCYGTWSTQ